MGIDAKNLSIALWQHSHILLGMGPRLSDRSFAG